MARGLCAVILLAALAASEGRAASPRPAVKEAEAETYRVRAVERFKAKDFDAAAKLFMQAYARSHAPALVYNAARAYEEGGKRGDAAGLFKLYISLTDDADGIVEARERVRQLETPPPAKPEPQPVAGRAEVEPARPAEPVPPPLPAAHEPAPVAPAAAPSPAPPPVVAPARGLPVAVSVPRVNQPPAWPRWTSTVAAGLALASGGTLLALGQSGTADANARLAAQPDAYNAAFDKAQAQWWTGAALTGVGVGLAGLSAWHWIRDADGGAVVGPAPNGVAVAGRF